MLSRAAKTAIITCIGLKQKEKILIIHDNSTNSIAKSLQSESLKITSFVQTIDLDRFKRPLRFDKTMLGFDPNVCIFLAKSIKGELKTLRRPLRKMALKKRIRYVHMPNIAERIFIDSVGVDYEKIWEFTRKLKSRLSPLKKMTVKTKAGTNVSAMFNLKWVSSDGNFRRFSKDKLNLPGAEILTCPRDVNGTLVVDGLLGNYFTQKYGELKVPLIVDIKRSRINRVHCKNTKLKKDFINYTSTDKNSNRVGEWAFGTNIFLKRYYHNFLVDEKYPGFHLAFGNPYPERTGAKWSSTTHLDCLIKKANTNFLKDGKYDLVHWKLKA